ncbi:MAG: SRPBCC domain-containing protein [Flavobacteriaceae bacterium]|nr:SRPBCC domain-containing protein [Flavobacteriaceae bacterium]
MENNGTVLKNSELKAPVSKVWEALTNPELTQKYFFDCAVISDFEVGSNIAFVQFKEDKEIVCVKGVISLCLPEKMLAYTCYSPEMEAIKDKHTLVTMALISEKEKTRLTITQGSFSDIAPYEQASQGWDFVLAGLKKLVES